MRPNNPECTFDPSWAKTIDPDWITANTQT
jgi:hypothetical protein